ncbi:receptor-like protein EIX2 [Neltuma alba]|uniref:receptor-like protein EIX2 n=1 Tax=Neltuma alba TaxID=207710 RepID=UPI0010A44759|nr:receptor-like protein EIX2 [Prosopis alba]
MGRERQEGIFASKKRTWNVKLPPKNGRKKAVKGMPRRPMTRRVMKAARTFVVEPPNWRHVADKINRPSNDSQVGILRTNGSKSCIEKEREALLEMEKGLVDDNQTGHVVKLDLRARDYDKPLKGPSFPKWLQTQKALSSLDVSDAGISDTATMASFLCSAKKSLTFLDMSSNHFKGQLPDCLNGSNSIRIIDFSNNKFSENIPTSMGSLLLVRHLILRNNHFTGQLPSLKNCTDLVMLDVGRNELAGPIPSWILGSNFPKSQVLSLTMNNFHGSLPSHLCHLSTIQILDLSMNNLFGHIPKCLQNFTTMTHKPSIYDTINQFFIFKNNSPSYWIVEYDFYPTVRWKGKELSFKDNKRLLRLIDLSENQLSDKIPEEIGSLSELVSLDLSNNNLSGEIPWELGKLHALDFLDLSTNRFSGKIPSSLSQIDRLAVLNLSHNNLSGKIPLGTQLQGFNASVYEGNPYLCGSPLERLCPDENRKPEGSFTIEKHDDDSIFSQGFYISMGLGFATGFWAIFGPLLLFPTWRHACFIFLHNLCDKIFVLTVTNISRCRRFFEK